MPRGDIERGLLAWLKSPGFAATIRPRLILGYGRQDRFAGASTILARVMPSERVIAIAGGHNWTTWRRLGGEYWMSDPANVPDAALFDQPPLHATVAPID
jgi:hypothetical protein